MEVTMYVFWCVVFALGGIIPFQTFKKTTSRALTVSLIFTTSSFVPLIIGAATSKYWNATDTVFYGTAGVLSFLNLLLLVRAMQDAKKALATPTPKP